MRKVIVACPCGQKMQVSRSAYGKIGICPKCNQKIRVGAGGVEPLSLPSPDMPRDNAAAYTPPRHENQYAPELDRAKKLFGQAVNLFYRSDYAGALSILENLMRELPGNPQIATARMRCTEAIERAKTAQTAQHSDYTPDVEPAQKTPPPPHKDAEPHQTQQEPLTPEAVHQALLYLLRQGSPDSVRLEAAELAYRILGLPNGKNKTQAATSQRETKETVAQNIKG